MGTVAQADPAGKWRIEFDDHADNDGTITLRVSPEGGTRIDVETDDGEDVVTARSGKTPKFEVTLASSTLTGLEVGIRRE